MSDKTGTFLGSRAGGAGSLGALLPIAGAFALAAGYAGLLAWFDRVDFYHHGFFVHGGAVRRYEIARLIFIPYFAWTIYAVGSLTSGAAFGCKVTAELPPWQRYPLCFVTGAGISHVVMFVIGLAGFDTKAVALPLSLGTMALSIPELAARLREFGHAVSRMRLPVNAKSLSTTLLWTAIIAASATFILVKGLYPGGGHDYYNHYFQFYNRVIETGSILPNNVWYHFYYSKGAGLYFLSMLLTDPLAPQLVATGFFACSAAIVYALLREATRSTLLPLFGVLLFVALFIYTPGPLADKVQGGWGILEKVHELTATLLLAVIWIAYRIFRNVNFVAGPWTLALHAAIVAIALLTLPLTLLVGLYCAGYVFWFTITRQWRIAVRSFAAGATAAFCLLAIGAINYICTGFPLDQMIVPFWRYADLAKVTRWGTMLEVLIQHQGETARSVSAPLASWDTISFLATYLRFELWWPIMLAAAPVVIVQLRNKATRTAMRGSPELLASSALGWFVVAVTVIAIFGGGFTQPISFYRMSTFSYGPTLCLALLLWHLGLTASREMPIGTRSPKILVLTSACAAVLSVILNLYEAHSGIRRNVISMLTAASRLAVGDYSLKDAYQNQEGWALTGTPWGAIYPGIVEPWRIAGPGTRIWSFHIQSYCMLPNCNIQEVSSERLSPSWQTVLFGPPEEGIKALKAEGLNYFFFSTELGVGNDPLPISPIFAPDQIARHLAIRWTDGTSYLLTWPNKETRPIDGNFLVAYEAAIKANPNIGNYLVSHYREISDYLMLHKNNLHPFFLPWCTNCQSLPPIDWDNFEQSDKM